MRIDQELAQSSPDQDTVLTIGVFDGVHLGHLELIAHLVRQGKDTGHVTVVVTFRSHPASVLRPDFKPRYVTSLDERISLIRQTGVDFVVPITFDRELSRLSARDFVVRLQRHLGMRGLVVGPDFALGHKRQGDVETLTNLGGELGFSVRVVDLAKDNGQAIKSTTIREALAAGDVTAAATLLGRNFVLTGVVVEGVGRGKTLGFPTANVKVQADMAMPGDGIYAAWARLGNSCHMAAVSIGTRPTFEESDHTVEAFVLDFEGDLYGQEVRLEFVQRLRDEVKYDTVQALQEQVEKDVVETRAILQSSRANAGKPSKLAI